MSLQGFEDVLGTTSITVLIFSYNPCSCALYIYNRVSSFHW